MLELSDNGRLSALLAQELELFEQLLALTEKQAKELTGDNIDALNISLEKTQDFMDKINGLHQQLDPLMQSYALLPDSGKDDRIDKLTGKIQEKAEMCVRLNNKNVIAMKKKTLEQTVKIKKQSAKRKGISAYAQAVSFNSEMFDKKT